MSENTGPGRPPVSNEEKQKILHKLEPYLKKGLSVAKACRQADLPTSTVYKIMNDDDEFMEQINTFKEHISVLVSDVLVGELIKIHNVHKKGERPLKKSEEDHVKWMALNSNLTKEEYGERKDISIVDPESEIKKIGELIDNELKEQQNAQNSND